MSIVSTNKTLVTGAAALISVIALPYYVAESDAPLWESGEIHIEASVEPSALGYEIGEPEDGFKFKYEWD